jgi:Sec-independent protein translocase protein TatA
MQKLIGVAFAALCLIGTSSLALADDAMKSEMGTMKGEMKAEKGAMKGKMKAHKDAMKAKHHAMKGKMKTHKDAAKSSPAVAAPMSAPVPVAAP